MFVIAGASGHVGSVAAENLLARGQKVRVIVRDAAKGTVWSKRGAEVAVGALEDQAFLANALRGASGFFTLLPPNYQAQDFFASQRTTADSIAAAVKDASVAHVGVALAERGRGSQRRGRDRSRASTISRELRAMGKKTTAIRAASFQENVANLLEPAKKMGIFPNFNPSSDYPVPMIATRDIGVLAAETLATPPAKSDAVDLEGPAYSARQVAEKLGAALGKTLTVVDIPSSGWVAALTQGGLSPSMAVIMAEMYAAFASGAIAPRGDRRVKGSTPIDDVIKKLV